MIIVFKLIAVMFCIVLLLKKRIALGNTMLIAAIVLFLMVAPEITVLQNTLVRTLTAPGTWSLMAAMYLVMCLEHQLRTTGVLDNFMMTVKKVFSDRALLAVMPGLIGFLPSLGGAIMSCPMVENASRRLVVSAEQKSTMNYWFRHIGEYANPIVPGMLLASEILQVPLRDLLIVLTPFGILSVILGWFLLVVNIKTKPLEKVEEEVAATVVDSPWRSIILALGPIILNIFLVVTFNLDAALSLAIVICVMSIVLRQRLTAIRTMFVEAYNFNLLWGVFGIITFQNMFNLSGAVTTFLAYMETTPISIELVIMFISFMGGLLCGVSQSMIALSFPIIAAMGTIDMHLVTAAYIFGVGGQMITPVHLCYPITVEYFKADFVKPMIPVIKLEAIMMLIAFAVTQWLS